MQHPEPDIQEKLKERLSQLPEPIRDFIVSDEFSTRVRTLAERHALNLWQGQVFENEILMAILGMESREGFSDALKKQLEVDNETAEKMTAEVESDIFQELRRILKDTESETNTQQAEESPSVEAELSEAGVEPAAVEQDVKGPEDASSAPPQSEKPEVDRLSQDAHSRSTEISLNDGGKDVPPKKKYSVDPYREPIE